MTVDSCPIICLLRVALMTFVGKKKQKKTCFSGFKAFYKIYVQIVPL